MDKKNKTTLQLMSRLEQIELIDRDDIDLDSYKKIKLDYLPELGVGLLALSKSARTVTSTIDGTGLFRAILPEGAHLAKTVNGVGYRGMAFDAKNHLVGAADFVDAGDIVQTTTVPIDPAMIAMAVALMSIERKLSSIQETTNKILNLIELHDKAQLEGDFEILKKIANEYKYNWNNQTYCSSKHNQVQLIQRDAMSKIRLYQKELNETLSTSMKLLHTKADIDKKGKLLKKQLSDYQLALYIYAYSDYLDVLLRNNFDANSLKITIKELTDLSREYSKAFNSAFSLIADNSLDSVERALVKGAATVTKKTGEFIAKLPVISKSNIDESLIATGDKLDANSDEKIVEYLENLMKYKDSGVMLFIDNLSEIKSLYSQQMEVILDKENLYYKQTEEVDVQLKYF